MKIMKYLLILVGLVALGSITKAEGITNPFSTTPKYICSVRCLPGTRPCQCCDEKGNCCWVGITCRNAPEPASSVESRNERHIKLTPTFSTDMVDIVSLRRNFFLAS